MFVGDVFYPLGGMADLYGDYDELAVAQSFGVEACKLKVGRRWFHVYDTETRAIIFQQTIKNL